jgi:hypothetical protein
MKQFNIQHGWLVLGALSFLPRTVLAQDQLSTEAPVEKPVASTSVDSPVAEETNESEWTYPKSYSVRPLTMQKGMIRANGIFTVWDDGVDTVFGMTLGASIAVLDDLELGINNYRTGSSLQQRYEGLIPVIFSPSAGFGNMPLYGRYRFVHREKLDFAGFAIPQLFEIGTSRSTVDFGIWDLFVGVAFYTRPLF